MDKTKDKKDCGCKDKNPKITLETPKGMKFNTPYPMPNMTSTAHPTHNDRYFDTNRNGKDDLERVKDEAVHQTNTFEANLDGILTNVGNLLKSKNEAYGNTSLNPPKIFSKLDSSEAICARIDDKIMRIKNRGLVSATEDTLTDLIGYLLLLKMSRKK